MKILVGCVTYAEKGYCLDSFLAALRRLEGRFETLAVDNSEDDTYAGRLRRQGFEVLRSPARLAPQLRLAAAYERLRKAFLERGAELLLSLEQDVIPPPDALRRLRRHHRPVIGGWYPIGGAEELTPCVLAGSLVPADEHPERAFVSPEGSFVGAVEGRPYLGRGLWRRLFKYELLPQRALCGRRPLRVYAVGLGCVLIRRRVLAETRFHCQAGLDGVASHCDMTFYEDCRRRNVPVWVDPTLRCEHLRQPEERDAQELAS